MPSNPAHTPEYLREVAHELEQEKPMHQGARRWSNMLDTAREIVLERAAALEQPAGSEDEHCQRVTKARQDGTREGYERGLQEARLWRTEVEHERSAMDVVQAELAAIRHERNEQFMASRDEANLLRRQRDDARDELAALQAKHKALVKVARLLVPALEASGLPHLARQLAEAFEEARWPG